MKISQISKILGEILPGTDSHIIKKSPLRSLRGGRKDKIVMMTVLVKPVAAGRWYKHIEFCAFTIKWIIRG